MRKIYIVGGQQKDRVTAEWHQYKKGVILEIDIDRFQLLRRHEYVSPPEVVPDQDPSIVYKAGTVVNRKLYVCTEREVMVYSLPDLRKLGYLSLPCFNDVHHVRPSRSGNYLVVSTGLDMVVEATPAGKLVNAWNVLGKPLWGRFSPSIDYRKVPTTKPHLSHPNYVFQLGHDVWVTRCLQKDAVCLTKPGRRINIGGAYVHDGVLAGNTLYFTRVDGHVVTVDPVTLQVKQQYNLNQMIHAGKKIGWCRGIKVLDQQTVIVGFTRVRPSSSSMSGQKVFNQLEAVQPTRIACYNLAEGKMLWELGLEKYNMHAVFSIHSENE
ncbi:hypothetical protein DNH61_17520 [Paenibacillus sambharensis]|uniref:Uncharacterized protein n=1 Tax=Paenibacillus sambharensis TaxID=1803190 RepID=A0A2W1L405_9BACL|nr:hypothetical protein [Paenibacillus sambharensis]PZD94748.1 hypothetical protein DNH61_17520 [Paenibacillus sambharensis]